MTHVTLSSVSAGGDETQYNPIEFMQFPGGERHARLPAKQFSLIRQLDTDWTITARIYTAADTMDLLLVNDALRRMIPARSVVRLVLPYVPYARQDRVAVAGEPLSIKVFANLINAMAFDDVEIWDPHSDVTPALLNNARIKSTRDLMHAAFFDLQGMPVLLESAFVAPDAGARKRVSALASEFGAECVFADKKRDPLTGKLSGAHVQGDLPAKSLLVVDDICDGGGTFIELAKVLREKTDQPLYLWVTHGLFTKGLEPLKQWYAGVFSANCRNPEIAVQLGVFGARDIGAEKLEPSA